MTLHSVSESYFQSIFPGTLTSQKRVEKIPASKPYEPLSDFGEFFCILSIDIRIFRCMVCEDILSLSGGSCDPTPSLFPYTHHSIDSGNFRIISRGYPHRTCRTRFKCISESIFDDPFDNHYGKPDRSHQYASSNREKLRDSEMPRGYDPHHCSKRSRILCLCPNHSWWSSHPEGSRSLQYLTKKTRNGRSNFTQLVHTSHGGGNVLPM